MDTHSNGNLKNVYWLALIFALSLTAIYYFQSYYTHFMTLFSNAFPLFIASAAVVASVFALRNYWENLESKLSRIWLGFSLGMIFWFIGELSWTIYTLIFNIKIPYPSVADVYRLIGYGFFFFAISTYIELFRTVISKRMVAVASIFILPTSTGIIPSLLLSVSAKASAVNLTTLLVGFAYPLLDLALLAQAMLGLLVFTMTELKGRLGSVWLLINAGIIMNVFGDLLFSYTNLQNTYYSGHPLELFFHLGYLFFILSFYTHVKKL
ncbi:MAG: hypothetical protein ACE5OV_03600 [Candidatus Bathyarchaeia archaeon]